MRTPILLALLASATAAQATLFDDFSSGAYDSGLLTAVGTTDAWQSPSSAAGGVRRVSSSITSNTFSQSYRVQIIPSFGMTFAESGVGVNGTLALGYGYANGSTAALSAPLNLNESATPLYRVTVMSNDLPNTATITLFSSTSGNVSRTLGIPGGIGTAQSFDFDFTGEAALADVDSVLVSFNPATNGDFAVSRIESVPEPATLAALGLGILGVVRSRRRR